MTPVAMTLETLAFRLPEELEATAPPEVRGTGRDDVKLLVASRHSLGIEHHQFRELPDLLHPGDVVVVNTSATMPAALRGIDPSGESIAVHVSTQIPGTDLWNVELRRPAGPASTRFTGGDAGWIIPLTGGGTAEILGHSREGSRLWATRLTLPDPLPRYLARHGRPIRYSYVTGAWPLASYQNVYAVRRPDAIGSCEMPSAGRPFTPEVVTALVARGVDVVPVALHTGVASLEDHEPPYAEWYEVSATSARRINAARADGGRVIAIGTTVVRALETAADASGAIHPATGWSEVLITPERGVRAVDGLITGWHEPGATHLAMLEAIAGRPLLELSYAAALELGYLWHEFGDLHLILP